MLIYQVGFEGVVGFEVQVDVGGVCLVFWMCIVVDVVNFGVFIFLMCFSQLYVEYVFDDWEVDFVFDVVVVLVGQ